MSEGEPRPVSLLHPGGLLRDSRYLKGPSKEPATSHQISVEPTTSGTARKTDELQEAGSVICWWRISSVCS